MRQFSKLGAFGLLAVAITLSACGGGGRTDASSAMVPSGAVKAQSLALNRVQPTATLTPPTWNGQTLSTKNGYYDKSHVWHNPVINGTDMLFKPPVADGPNGGHGPVGSSLDGVQCQATMSSNYHIHVFFGLYVNGQEYAIPRGIGVVEPLNPNALDILYATQCFYFTHTHDSTGIIHVEDFNNGVPLHPPTTSKYMASNLFAVWGITVNPTQFGQFGGNLEVFTSGQHFRKISPTGGGTIKETTLTQWTGDPAAIPMYDHEVIWYLVGPTYPTSLPNINFAPGY